MADRASTGIPRMIGDWTLRLAPCGLFGKAFGAVDEGFVVDVRGIEDRDEFEEIRLAFEEVGEEIEILRGQGAELVEERFAWPPAPG
jgi:hypothetical protein